MKKLVLIFFFIFAFSYGKNSVGENLYKNRCANCHGKHGEIAALQKSKPIKGRDAKSILKDLKEYRVGSLDKYGLGGLMKAQVRNLSDKELEELAKYISTLK